MRSTRRHAHGARPADVARALRDSVTSHVILVVVAIGTSMGAIVRLALGGGLISGLVLLFALLAASQGYLNIRKLRAMQARLAADPESAPRMHAIPRVPFLQGFIGRG